MINRQLNYSDRSGDDELCYTAEMVTILPTDMNFGGWSVTAPGFKSGGLVRMQKARRMRRRRVEVWGTSERSVPLPEKNGYLII